MNMQSTKYKYKIINKNKKNKMKKIKKKKNWKNKIFFLILLILFQQTYQILHYQLLTVLIFLKILL